MHSRVLPFLCHPDADGLDATLAEGVRFHSPVADYHGRADVMHLFAAIARVLDGVVAVRELEADAELTTFIAGTVEGHPIQGVLDEHFDEAGHVVDVTLMMRPMSGLQLAVRAMRAVLETSPLPSSA